MRQIWPNNNETLSSLLAAEARAVELLIAIQTKGFIKAGRSERDVEKDIQALCVSEFGIERHWHKKVVRAGINTLCIASDNPPDRLIEDDDIVFVDLGPVFEDLGQAWEADVGMSLVVGSDPQKQKLCDDLEIIFEEVVSIYRQNLSISGAELYDISCARAKAHGWDFGGKIAGHIVGEFPHALKPGEKDHGRISPQNKVPMNTPDLEGNQRFWILEIHLVSPDGQFGGFYERLLLKEGL
jgi:Xaa-Pro aminopeptidase